jgi:transposase
MDNERITMSITQLNRFDVLSKANGGFITVREASEALGISERQVKRLKKKVRDEGAAGVIHKNTDRAPSNKISIETKGEILNIRSRPEYSGSNFRHFKEILLEHHQIDISYGSLHRLLVLGGIKSPKTKRRKKVHRRRQRKPQAGLMLQTDATPFAWFKDDRKLYSIHGAIDDSTGQITGLFMCRNECLHGYFEMLFRTIDNYGVPKSMYADRHTIFQSPNTKKHEIDASIKVKDTQFGRCLKELGVTLIAAKSAQAKGRIERLWGTLQSRLPVEFAMKGITTIEDANNFLQDYIYKFNSEFAVEPKNTQSMFRKIDKTTSTEHILCIKETRSVDAGGVFSYGNKSFKVIDKENVPPIPAKAKIQVLIGARLGIKAEWKCTVYDVLPFVPPKRTKKKPIPLKTRTQPLIPPPEHVWRTNPSMHIQIFDEYERLDEYNDTIRMLERKLLGKNR